MDFGRPLVVEESIASRSKIRYVVPTTTQSDSHHDDNEEEEDEDRKLDRMVIDAANQVARECLLGTGPPTSSSHEQPQQQQDHAADAGDSTETTTAITNTSLSLNLINTSLYKEYSTPLSSLIQANDLVVIMEAFDKLDFVYVQPGQMFFNRNGHFAHDSFIGKPFGSMVRSNNHNRGYGFVYLLKPTAELWARSLNHRTQIVQELDQVQVVFQLQIRPNMKVLESGTGSGAMSHALARSIAPKGQLYTFEFNHHRSESAREEFEKHGIGHLVTVKHQDVCSHGFGGLPAQSMDACFLDLPEPWLAIPHAMYCLKAGARVASYSPCMEQTQRVCQTLKEFGCHSIQTMEYRLMEHYVDEVEYDLLPTEPRPLLRSTTTTTTVGGVVNNNNNDKEDGVDTAVNNEDDNDDDEEEKEADDKVAAKTTAAGGNSDTAVSNKRRKRLVARPFNTMRGHTAFLTYATTGRRPQKNPLEK
jgi:tRNA (adenine57-N1/adenine58-N1)-methyltransferase